MTTPDDPALHALLRPLHDGLLDWPAEGALFLGARAGTALQARPWPRLVWRQPIKPLADALQRAGHAAAGDEATRRWPLVLVLPPRQREQARALFAQALTALAPGGRVLAAAPNAAGAKSAEADLARLAGPLSTLSKHHCRVFWTAPLDAPPDLRLAAEWAALDAPRRIADPRAHGGGFVSRPGVFAWDRVDAASALLVAHLPAELAGRGADLGAGWGYLATQVLARCPRVTAFDLYEADARALACARENLAPFAARVQLGFHWHDVGGGVPGGYDFVVCNPPFHGEGSDARPELGRAFLRAAAAALRPGGCLFLVANRQLPYERTLAEGFADVRTLAQADGYKVCMAVAR